MNFDILRQKILDKAIRGELVPQLESEPEVAQIGKTPNNVPFAIPKKWKWNQLLDIFYVYQPKTISMKELSDSGDYFVYGANGIIGRYTNYNHENSEVVIACRGATCGAVNVTLPKSWINGNAMVVKPRNDLVCHDYLVAFLKVFNWKKVISGSAQPQITRKNLATVLFPLPPLEEQHRIVAKLNQLCDQIESAENAYKELSGSLSERFKQLCLEKAVQGKLVPQLESEPEVVQIGESPKNVPFAIPEKWKWIQFSNAVKVISSRPFQIKAKEVLEQGTYPVISQSKEKIDGFCNDENKLIPESELPLIIFGDHTRILKYIDYRFVVGADGTKLLRVKTPAIDPKYFYIVLQSMIGQTRKRGYSRHFQFLKALHVPVPPIEEQRRIVARLDDLFSVLNTTQLEPSK